MLSLSMSYPTFQFCSPRYKRIVNDRNIKLAFAVVWLAAILPFLLVIGGIGVCSSCTCTDNAKLSCYGQECSTISVLTGKSINEKMNCVLIVTSYRV